MREYGRVHGTFWSSKTIASLSDDGKLLALYLMTCPHNTIAGVFRLPDGYVTEDMGWEAERVRAALRELSDKDWAHRCEDTKWVWIVNHCEWNPPENPNQRKAVAKVAMTVPDGCGWRVRFIRQRGHALGLDVEHLIQETVNEGLTNGFGNRCETLEQPFLNQEQEQEQEQKQEQQQEEISTFGLVGEADPKPGLPNCPHQVIVEHYHQVLPELPRVKLMSEARKKAITAFWRWVLTSKKSDGTPRASTADQALTWIRQYFERARLNDFLMGRTQRGSEHANWRCDLDFLLTERGKRHVIEKTLEATA